MDSTLTKHLRNTRRVSIETVFYSYSCKVFYLVTGEGWFGLEPLHKLTKDTTKSYRLKVTLTSREWQEFVGYWDWLKVITA